MNITNPFFPVLIYLVAFFTAFLLQHKFTIIYSPHRNESIDGFRGFLALGVYIHHSSYWYIFLKKGEWRVPDSNLLLQLGHTSVSFFFMITGFLFISKLVNSKDVNWKHFFISRVLRLAPLYILVLIVIVMFSCVAQQFELKTSPFTYVLAIFKWGIFGIAGRPLINSFALTDIITAGVTWTLTYEWLFYCMLPVIALFFLKKVGIKYIVVAILFVLIFFMNNSIHAKYIYPFIAGAIAPFVIKYLKIKIDFNHLYFSVVILVLLMLVPFIWASNNLIFKFSMAFIFILIFTLVALGNTFFGLLRSPVLKLLGEICYSTYLIHGIILFTWFYFILGLENAKKMSELSFVFNILGLTPIVVIVSYILFVFIEKPFMSLSSRIRTTPHKADLLANRI